MIKRIIPKSEFTRNALKLMTGTGLAQAVQMAFAPILTRLYSPEDFGVLALYISISSILAIVATARYEFAIMLPDNEKDSISIVFLSIMISFFLSSLIFIVVALFGDQIASYLGNKNIKDWLYFVPLSILFTGSFQALNYWLNRNKQFGFLAKNRLLQTGATNINQGIMGLGGTPIYGGLIFGIISGQLIAFLHLLHKCKNSLLMNFKTVTWQRVSKNAKRYKKFPIFSSWGAIMNTSASQAPVLITSKAFGVEIVGFFSLSFRVLSLPLSLVSSALSQVLYERIIDLSKNNPDQLFTYIFKLFLFLLVLSSPLFIVMNFWGEELFSFVFGENWKIAGKYAGIMSISICFQFAVSPLSSIFILDHHLKKNVFWQTLYFISIITVLSIFSHVPFETLLKIYVAHEIVLYSLHLFLILYAASKPTAQNTDTQIE